MSGYYQPDLLENLNRGNPPLPFYNQGSSLTDPQSLSSANLSRWFDLESETSRPAPKGAARVRRRPPHGSDHVKHRRTRSGCYTCRGRRVKCDERHPICDRCKKGGRECVYPEPLSSIKSTSGSKLGRQRKPVHESDISSGEYEDEDGQTALDPSTCSPELEEGQSSSPPVRLAVDKHSYQNDTSSLTAVSTGQSKEKSPSPSTEESASRSKSRSTSSSLPGMLSSVSTIASPGIRAWSHLPQDLQYHLDYHQRHITHHHYFFKHDATNFVHSTLVEIAPSYEPLLYAVVGFAAFQATLKKPDGKIQDFLCYYNKSVYLLRKSLQAQQKHTDATMLTILQLAAFEEYLGDWVNLLSHQKAAYEMLLELYSPETIADTEVQRKILAWYARFDLFAGLMSGYETVLGREWMLAYERYYTHQSYLDPSNLDYKIESNIGKHRLMAMDMAILFAKLPRGAISIQDFMRENQLISENISRWKQELDPLLLNSEHLVMSYDGAPEPDPNDIVDPYKPGGLYKGPLFSINFMLLDRCAVELMHKYQTSLMLKQPPPPDLESLALELLRIFETIDYWPDSPPGAVLPAQASLGIATLFLPKDDRHIMWCRRKLARMESMGYIYPAALRNKMAELWGDPDVLHWWLPKDEGYPSIIRSIRSFIEDRTVEPTNQPTQDLRSLKAIFSKLSVDDSPKESPESSGSAAGEVSAQYEQTPLGQNPMPVMETYTDDLGFDQPAADTLPAWNIDDGQLASTFYAPPGR